MAPLQITSRNIRKLTGFPLYLIKPILFNFFWLLTWTMALQVIQISTALSYLHDRSIIHGDIKGVSDWFNSFFFSHTTQSNILINDNLEASLTDFGLSRILQKSGFTTKTGAGSFRFMAPEQMKICLIDEEPLPRVTAATDVWAFSMTVIEVSISTLTYFRIGHVPHYKMLADILWLYAFSTHPRGSRRHSRCYEWWPSQTVAIPANQSAYLEYVGKMLECWPFSTTFNGYSITIFCFPFLTSVTIPICSAVTISLVYPATFVLRSSFFVLQFYFYDY